MKARRVVREIVVNAWRAAFESDLSLFLFLLLSSVSVSSA